MHPPPANIRSPELSSPAQLSSPERVFLRLGVSLPEEILQKDYHLRPRRLRRNTAAGKSTSSGQHSLPGAELAGTTLFSGKGFPPVRGFPAGGNPPKRSSPPTTAASPEFSHPPCILLRRTFARRNCDRWHNSLLRQGFSSGKGLPCRRKSSKKIITSDHRGFAGEYCKWIEPPVRRNEPLNARNRAGYCERESHPTIFIYRINLLYNEVACLRA